ncbi:hypothetical protein F3J19_29085 [Burkholderia sp. Ax-1724]|nr:hypothetical protein [Burkholderia sp. Ax-1724]
MISWRNSGRAFWLSLTLPMAAGVLFIVSWPWVFVMVVLFVVPVLDAVIGRGIAGEGQVMEKKDEVQVPLWFVFAWIVVIGIGACRSSTASWMDLIGFAVASGILSSTAMAHLHELAHRSSSLWREVSDIGFVIAGYPHYRTAHQLHHQHVGNQRFGSTASVGTSVWRHVGCSYTAALISSFSRHSYRDGKVPRHLFRNVLFSLLMLISAVFLKTRIAMFYVGYVIVSVFVVEAVGYMQHYGFDRHACRATITAWDVDFWLSNRLLINNGFHNAHHRHSGDPFMRLTAQSITLPGGYFQMLWLTLFPSLWFSVMNRRTEILLRRQRRRCLTLRNQIFCDSCKIR